MYDLAMTTCYFAPGSTGALLGAIEGGDLLYSKHDAEEAWLERPDGSRQAVDWRLLEQLINTGALLPITESGRTRWSVPDKARQLRFLR
jgi:hypothetical protein